MDVCVGWLPHNHHESFKHHQVANTFWIKHTSESLDDSCCESVVFNPEPCGQVTQRMQEVRCLFHIFCIWLEDSIPILIITGHCHFPPSEMMDIQIPHHLLNRETTGSLLKQHPHFLSSPDHRKIQMTNNIRFIWSRDVVVDLVWNKAQETDITVNNWDTSIHENNHSIKASSLFTHTLLHSIHYFCHFTHIHSTNNVWISFIPDWRSISLSFESTSLCVWFLFLFFLPIISFMFMFLLYDVCSYKCSHSINSSWWNKQMIEENPGCVFQLCHDEDHSHLIHFSFLHVCVMSFSWWLSKHTLTHSVCFPQQPFQQSPSSWPTWISVYECVWMSDVQTLSCVMITIPSHTISKQPTLLSFSSIINNTHIIWCLSNVINQHQSSSFNQSPPLHLPNHHSHSPSKLPLLHPQSSSHSNHLSSHSYLLISFPYQSLPSTHHINPIIKHSHFPFNTNCSNIIISLFSLFQLSTSHLQYTLLLCPSHPHLSCSWCSTSHHFCFSLSNSLSSLSTIITSFLCQSSLFMSSKHTYSLSYHSCPASSPTFCVECCGWWMWLWSHIIITTSHNIHSLHTLPILLQILLFPSQSHTHKWLCCGGRYDLKQHILSHTHIIIPSFPTPHTLPLYSVQSLTHTTPHNSSISSKHKHSIHQTCHLSPCFVHSLHLLQFIPLFLSVCPSPSWWCVWLIWMWNCVQLTSLFSSQSYLYPLTHKHSSFFNLSHPILNSLLIPFSINTTHTLPPQSVQSTLTNHSSPIYVLSFSFSVCLLTTSLHPSSQQIEHFPHFIIKPSTWFQSSHFSCPLHNWFNSTHFSIHSLSLTFTSKQQNNHLFHHSFLCFFILFFSNSHSSIPFHQSFFQQQSSHFFFSLHHQSSSFCFCVCLTCSFQLWSFLLSTTPCFIFVLPFQINSLFFRHSNHSTTTALTQTHTKAMMKWKREMKEKNSLI